LYQGELFLYFWKKKSNQNQISIDYAVAWSKERKLVLEGEIIVIVAGMVEGVPGSTNMMRVEVVK